MNSVFEERNIQKAIVTLGVPAMLGQLATLIYNIVDTYFVSLTDMPAQIAAVTLCSPILLIVMSVSSVFGMGGASVIARLLGAKKQGDAEKCVNYCFYTLAISGVVTLFLGLLLVEPIARLAGADAENIVYTCDYLRWIFIGAPFIILSTGMAHILRSTALIKEAMISILLGNAVNILFDWIFIVLLGMGTAGAAAATSFGYLCATVYLVIVVRIRKGEQRELYALKVKEYRPAKAMTFDVVKIGIPGALITVMLSAANIVLNNFIGIYGSDAVASYGIAYRIVMFPMMLLVGLGQGVAPLIGYCYGAEQDDRLNKVMVLASFDGGILGAVFTVVFLFTSELLTSIFLRDQALIEQSALFLRILCLSAPLQGLINMVTSYFQALGKALPSLLITLLRNVVIFVPCVVLANLFFGLNGIIAAQPVVEALLAAVCIIMYRLSITKIRNIAISTASLKSILS